MKFLKLDTDIQNLMFDRRLDSILMYFDSLKPNPMFKLLHYVIIFLIDEKSNSILKRQNIGIKSDLIIFEGLKNFCV